MTFFRFVERARERRTSEQGFYMVWFALTFVTLTAFAGLALEYNRWQQIGTRAQKAADAAALGGAVFLPDNLPKATTTATTIATENGFTGGSNGATISVAVGRLPNQLKVTVSVKTNNPWGALVGYKSTTIAKSAVAEYQLPQNLGSPQNIYGNDPEVADQSTQPQFWGNVFGPSSIKSKGDAIQSVGATANTTLCDSDNCNGPASPGVPVAGQNRDYDANGYFYGIDVPANPSGALSVQVFDPAFVHVGDNCTDAAAVSELNNAANLTAAQIPGYTGTILPSARYASGTASPFCTGDMSYSGDANNNLNPWTTYTLRAPDISTWDPTNNPIVCQAQFPGIFPETTNDQPNGPSDSANGYTHLSSLLTSNTNYPNVSVGGAGMNFAQFFRQWVTLCTVNNPVQGTYFLQVQTAKKFDPSNPTNPPSAATPNGGGANRFAVRAGIGGSYATNNGLHVYGNQKMGVYANETSAATKFYLTRVLPGEAGKTLVINFFDIGDGAGQTSTVKVIPPTDSNVGASFAGCTYTPPPGNSSGPPWGTLTATASDCSVPVTQAAFNGNWVTFEIPIPNNYTCTSSDALGCWLKLSAVFSNGGVQDTTTWSAYILGEPVRIIQ